MATYKVLQDIEAEDKFIGPLTLKQFILAAVCIVSIYISFLLLTKGVWVLVFPLVPVIIVSGFLAFPWGRDQPTEVWLFAKIRFMFKPRKRIWDQTGMQELVRITVPKKIEEHLSDGLSQTEVKSRLKALADTIDTRGWAIKGVDGATAAQLVNQSSDRLVAASSLPQTSPTVDMPGVSDIFENPQADAIASQIASSSQRHLSDVVENMRQPRQNSQAPPADFWFMNQPDPASGGMASFGTTPATPLVDDPGLPQYARKPAPSDPNESQILSTLHAQKSRNHDSFRNHKSLTPLGASQPVNPGAYPVTAAPDPATIELARNNDRNIESIAREGARNRPSQDDDEVIVSLH